MHYWSRHNAPDADPDDDGNGDVPSPISPASGQQRVAWACKELLTNALLTNTISTLLYINTQAQFRMSLQFTLNSHPVISCILFVLKRSVLHIELDSDWPPPLYSHHWAEIASSGRPLPPSKVFFLVPNWIGSYTQTVKLIMWVPAFTVCYHEENLSVFPVNTDPFDILFWPILLSSLSFLITSMDSIVRIRSRV